MLLELVPLVPELWLELDPAPPVLLFVLLVRLSEPLALAEPLPLAP